MSDYVLPGSRLAGRPRRRGSRSRILSVALVVAAVATALALDGRTAAASPSSTPDTTAGASAPPHASTVRSGRP